MTPKPPRKCKARLNVRASVRLRAYDILSSALDGVGRGAVRRAYKHRDEPMPPDEVIEQIESEVHERAMVALGEILDFGSVWP